MRGTDTAFTKELKAGDHTHIVGVGTYIVGSIANDSELVLTTPVESLEACPNPAETKLALVSAAGQLPCPVCTALTDAGCSSIDIDRHDVYRVLASCPASPALSRTLAAFGRVERKQKEEEERKAKVQEAEEKKALKYGSAVEKAKLLVEEAKHLATYIYHAQMPGAKYRVTRTVIVFTCIAPLVTQNGATHVGTWLQLAKVVPAEGVARVQFTWKRCQSSKKEGCGTQGVVPRPRQATWQGTTSISSAPRPLF